MTPTLRAIFGERPVRRFSPYIFGVLVIGLTLHPYVLQMTLHSAWLPYVEGVVNLLIVAFGALVYYLYERERRVSESRLLEASKYIGAVNRKLPILKEITTDLLAGDMTSAKQKAKVFQKLVGLAAVTIAKSDRGLMRFIDIETGRTVKEFRYALKSGHVSAAESIGNKELLACETQAYKRQNPSPNRLVIATSDRAAPIRAFLVIHNVRERIAGEIHTLQAIVDQGQLLWRYLFDDISNTTPSKRLLFANA